MNRQIKAFRHWYHISQEDLGEMIGVTRQAVAKWEHGESVPDVLTMKKLADKFHITLDELVRFHEGTDDECRAYEEHILFDTIKVENDGKIQLTEEMCKFLEIVPGEELLVLGDRERGIELLTPNCYWDRLLK